MAVGGSLIDVEALPENTALLDEELLLAADSLLAETLRPSTLAGTITRSVQLRIKTLDSKSIALIRKM